MKRQLLSNVGHCENCSTYWYALATLPYSVARPMLGIFTTICTKFYDKIGKWDMTYRLGLRVVRRKRFVDALQAGLEASYQIPLH